MDWSVADVRILQLSWILLILASPYLCWRAARAAGVPGRPALIAIGLAMAIALAAVAGRDDEPLHANGHAWREAREVLTPMTGRNEGMAPFEHGRAGIALQWLIAAVEQSLTGSANPFRISRLAAAGAAGAAALLAIVLAGSPWAGCAAGGALALMPLERLLAVSGSTLAIAACILPLSLALMLAAARSGDPLLLAGGALATALGTLSHTAMLAWAPALALVWIVMASGRARWNDAALAAALAVGAAWLAQLANAFGLLTSRNAESSLFDVAWRGLRSYNLFTDRSWVSPLLLVLVGLWMITSLRARRRVLLAVGVACAVGLIPFFAVTACSSDAARYQGPLLGMATALAIAGMWQTPLTQWLGRYAATAVRAVLIALIVIYPLPSARQPTDPVALEHRLVAAAAGHISPGTLIVLPTGRFAGGRIIPEFPDFLLPRGSRVVLADDPVLQTAAAPRLLYLGLACISWDAAAAPGEVDGRQAGMRPECLALRGTARPWLVRTLEPADLPRGPEGNVWTFHRLAIDVAFGFFADGEQQSEGPQG